ncbi:hypothetical protein KCTC52924_00753 [Arenibacter antarcticus]|uniref:TonB family protein n=1 Tax=Arenibacter antarcticus TaxID=2040469 RepID=A0ABW5VC27_9FLAO|nr:M56 family metallopeptidase [Arenibacter sp. H213]
MIQYILECMVFQLLFLIVYDLFLKRETFFQWNRAYLLGSFVLSLLLPWIKIEALKSTVSQESFVYPEYLWGMDMSSGFVGAAKPTASFHLSITEMVLYAGMLIAAVLFCFKLYQLYRLKRKGEIRYFENFTRIMMHNSQMAFSFFRSIFIGDKVLEKDHDSIIQHELVHIEHRHSLDLLFFELMRIIGWFNPLVYVYQNRVSEVHEFIADAKVAKTHKSEQYQLLLSQVFQTQNISFINHFYKSSLIKKRIVMLQKTQSKQIWRLKYLLMLPLVLGMLVYTSMEGKASSTIRPDLDLETIGINYQDPIDVPFAVAEKVPVFPGCENSGDMRVCFNEMMQKHISENFRYPEEAQKKGIQGRVNIMFVIQEDGSIGDFRMRGPDTLLEEEAARIISLLPKMTPGEYKGEKVRIPFSIPITFKLQGDEDFDLIDNSSAPDMAAKYNELLKERERLLRNSNNKNPVIVNLDQQLKALQKQIGANDIYIPFATIEKAPLFPGCEDAEDRRVCFNQMMQKHISENFRYPEEAQKKGIEGRVNIMFVIQEDGSIGDLRMRGPDKLLEKEAARIISLLPKMTPGEHRGKAARVPFSIPITFKLDPEITAVPASMETDQMPAVPFAIVEEVPIFPGCENAEDKRACFNEMMQEHIAESFRYPEEAQKKNIQGRVNIMFMIGTDGFIGNVVLEGPDKLLEEEARRMVSLLPEMSPGKQKGKKVRVPYSTHITFKLQ